MKKKVIIIGGSAVFILAIIVPIFLDYCILGNGIKSNIGNDVWMAFFWKLFWRIIWSYSHDDGVV